MQSERPAEDDARKPANMPKKKILFVALCLDFGGAERHLSNVMPELVRRGWPVSVYCTNRLGVFAQSVQEAGVEVIGPPIEARPGSTRRSMRFAYSLLAGVRLLGVMRRLRPHIIHFFLPEPYIIGAPLSLLQRIPIRIMSRRSLSHYQKHWIGVRTIERHLHPRMTAVLGNSRRVVDDLIEEGCEPAKVGLIYNGVKLDAFGRPLDRTAVRHGLGIGATDLVIIVVANLAVRKAHQDLLDALALAASELPQPWKLVCVGRNDGCLAPLQEQAARLGLAGNVLFLGERSDVAELLGASDVGVLASLEEGFSNAILESMAAGLPMVVTDVGGNAEAVLNGHTGLVVPPSDPAALADAIGRIAGDRAWAAQLGAAARLRAKTLFSHEACVDHYEALYEGLMNGKAPADIPALKRALKPA
jgi:glycosyltransferase involved in cell wall biosynthesis